MEKANTLGTIEKRELAKIIDKEFSTIINNLKQEMKYTEGEILQQAEKKFGLKCIDKEIEQLKSKISMLEKRKTDLGFSAYHGKGFAKTWIGNDNVIDPNTQAGRFYYMKVARNVDIQNLEKQRDDRLKNLWLTNIRTDIKALVEKKVDIKMIDKPKTTNK